jgi:acyl-CoA thioester hydrolase
MSPSPRPLPVIPGSSPGRARETNGAARGDNQRLVSTVEAEAAEFAGFGVELGWWSFAIRHRVRWSECDPFRHANHRAYFEWFEEARNRYLETASLPELSAGSPGPVMAETSVRYHRPLAYGDEILISARTVRIGNTSFEMEYAVWRQGLCALGRAVLILVVNATGEKTPLPSALRRAMLARDPGAVESARTEGISG